MRTQPPLGPSGATSAGAVLRVGSALLRHCLDDYYCGTLRVALDPADHVPGKIDIAFAWLPRSNRNAQSAGTIVAVEGGPGYPSIGSRSLYRGLYAPLLRTRDLLLVDNRGTGESAAIVCRPLQTAPIMKLSQVTRCGKQLARAPISMGRPSRPTIWPRSCRRSTSVKSTCTETHTARSSCKLLRGAIPTAFDRSCSTAPIKSSAGVRGIRAPDRRFAKHSTSLAARSRACNDLDGSSLGRIERLLAKLRRENGHITPTGVAFAMDTAGLDPLAFRDLDAAARAYVDARTTPPRSAGSSTKPMPKKKAPAVTPVLTVKVSSRPRAARTIRRFTICACHRRNASRAWQAKRCNEKRADRSGALRAVHDRRVSRLCRSTTRTSRSARPGPSRRSYHPGRGSRFRLARVFPERAGARAQRRPRHDHDAAGRRKGGEALRAFATQVIVANTGHVTALDDLQRLLHREDRSPLHGTAGKGRCRLRRAGGRGASGAGRSRGRLDEVRAADAGRRQSALPVNGSCAPARTRCSRRADVLARSYEFGLRSWARGLRGGTFSASPGKAVDRATLDAGALDERSRACPARADADARSGERARQHLTLYRRVGRHAGRRRGRRSAATAQATLHGALDGFRVRATMPAP